MLQSSLKMHRIIRCVAVAVAGSGGVNMEAIGEKEKPSDVVRQQAEDRLVQTIGLSHW